jgi:carbonic anhydrase
MSLNESTQDIISADQALQRLRSSNERFLLGTARFSRIRKDILADLAKGQHPYATILCCSDSRVPPELIFDACFGELFVVRIAGNIISPEIFGSLQYAGAHLKTPLFVVLGHEGCGAVEAAVEAKLRGVQPLSRIRALIDNIIPGLADLDPALPPADLLSKAVESNVRWTIRQIQETPEYQVRLAEARMRLVGGIYDIESGQVRFLT